MAWTPSTVPFPTAVAKAYTLVQKSLFLLAPGRRVPMAYHPAYEPTLAQRSQTSPESVRPGASLGRSNGSSTRPATRYGDVMASSASLASVESQARQP